MALFASLCFADVQTAVQQEVDASARDSVGLLLDQKCNIVPACFCEMYKNNSIYKHSARFLTWQEEKLLLPDSDEDVTGWLERIKSCGDSTFK